MVFFAYPFVKAVETKCIFCCNVGCDGAQIVPASPTPSPTVTPTPTPSPSPTPTPSDMPMTFAGSMVYNSNQTSADKFKTYAKVMVQSWYANSSQSWCNELREEPTTVDVCVPYMDFGGWFTGCNSSGTNCSANEWTPYDEYQLDSTYLLYKEHSYSEAVMDWRDSTWVDLYKAMLVNGWANGTRMAKAGSGHNGQFFDNCIFDGQTWWWNNNGGVTRAAWKTAMSDALTTIRSYYDSQGDVIFANVWGDFNDWDLYNADKPYYWAQMDKIDYAMFEVGVSNYQTGTPMSETSAKRYIDIAFDYNTNTTALVLWNTEYGEFWYNFTAGLFTCTSTKCGYWQQPPMSDAQISIVTNLGLGTPTANYALSGCYYRTFTNGVAVANLTSSSCNYTLPAGNYTDVIAGGTVSGQRTLSANTGKIYRKQ